MLAVVDTNATTASEAKARFPLGSDIRGNPTSLIQVDPGKPVPLEYEVRSDMKNECLGDRVLRIVADKYEESKPERRPIDQAACTCEAVF
jgi:hypothetical protein